MELSAGDDARVEEIRLWLKQGMKIAEVRKQLTDLGYSEYHISFLLQEASGQRFLPKRPKVFVDTRNIRIGMVLFFVMLMILAVILLFPEVTPW